MACFDDDDDDYDDALALMRWVVLLNAIFNRICMAYWLFRWCRVRKRWTHCTWMIDYPHRLLGYWIGFGSAPANLCNVCMVKAFLHTSTRLDWLVVMFLIDWYSNDPMIASFISWLKWRLKWLLAGSINRVIKYSPCVTLYQGGLCEPFCKCLVYWAEMVSLR